jgi:hypothetical protein
VRLGPLAGQNGRPGGRGFGARGHDRGPGPSRWAAMTATQGLVGAVEDREVPGVKLGK